MIKIIRKIIPHLPRGKTLTINLALKLFGKDFNDTIEVDGRKFYISELNNMNRSLFFLGERDMNLTNFVKNIIKDFKGDWTAIDLGANFGWYSTLFAQYGAKVYAFEIAKEIHEDLIKTVALNEFDIRPERVAIGDRISSMPYYYSKKEGNANLSKDKIISSDASMVGMITLDSYFERKNIPKADFIKCDIDGAELLFLEGAKKVLSTHPKMIIEFVYNQRQLLKKLLEYGYTSFWAIQSNKYITLETADIKDDIYCWMQE